LNLNSLFDEKPIGALSQSIKDEIKESVAQLKAEGKNIPHLAAILIGDNPASESYVRNKTRSCDYVGFESTLIRKDDSITEEELLDIVQELNNNDDVDGFIVQLPLPKQIIDVGINRVEDDSRKAGYRLVGDVEWDSVAPKASYITPVPGGVGPMTVTSLLMNTLKASAKEIYG